MAMQTSNRMAGIFFTILSLLGLARGLEVLFPAGGNVWDLDQVNSYKVFWRSASADPTHVHVALHDAAGNVVDYYESVRTSSGSYLISGLSGIPSGSNYRIVLSDSTTPKRKVVARSGKFSIRQVADSASSGISQDIAPTTTQSQPATSETVTTSIPPPSSTTEVVPTALGSEDLSSTPTPTSSRLQTTSQEIPTASTTYPSSASSSRTSISTQTSTGFPKFVIPDQKGLSKGAKIGIGVGVAVLLLIGLGVCIFFWRRRRRQQQESRYWNKAPPGMSTPATHDAHHGKPELVGDQASLFDRDPGVRYVQKPELETRSSITNCSESNDRRNEVQPVPFGVAELPQPACMQVVPVGMVELPQRSPGHHAPVHGRIAAEIDISTPRHPHHPGQDNAHIGPSDGTEDGVRQYQPQHQPQYQDAVELPARNPTRNARNGNSNGNSIPPPQPSRPAPPLSPQQELLPTAPTTLPLPSSSPLLRSPCSATPATAAPSTPLPPLPPSQDKTTKHDDDNNNLATLRRRERTIAESISAAEALERLRREHIEVQERIRIAEASKGATSGG